MHLVKLTVRPLREPLQCAEHRRSLGDQGTLAELLAGQVRPEAPWSALPIRGCGRAGGRCCPADSWSSRRSRPRGMMSPVASGDVSAGWEVPPQNGTGGASVSRADSWSTFERVQLGPTRVVATTDRCPSPWVPMSLAVTHRRGGAPPAACPARVLTSRCFLAAAPGVLLLRTENVPEGLCTLASLNKNN